jgi:hypothetical protein
MVMRPGEEHPRRVFVGIAEAEDGVPPTLNEALESAAGLAIDAELIDSVRTAWFEIAFIEVELGNQHPRTMKVGVTPIPEGR